VTPLRTAIRLTAPANFAMLPYERGEGSSSAISSGPLSVTRRLRPEHRGRLTVSIDHCSIYPDSHRGALGCSVPGQPTFDEPARFRKCQRPPPVARSPRRTSGRASALHSAPKLCRGMELPRFGLSIRHNFPCSFRASRARATGVMYWSPRRSVTAPGRPLDL
jgi:hypothetical protein